MSTQSTNVYEIQKKQKEIIIEMIKTNKEINFFNQEENKQDELFWKVMIFDQFNSDLLSLQLTIGEVRGKVPVIGENCYI